MIYALIENSKVVNLIILNQDNEENFPNAVLVNDLPVTFGDDYIDGIFYRNGKEVLKITDQDIYNEGYDRAVLDLMGV